MEWKSKIEDERCADELEEMMIDYVKSGFYSKDEILMECEDYIADIYLEECKDLTREDLEGIVEVLCGKFQNKGNQENFLKLDAAFHSLEEHGVVALHYTGYTQSEGFEDCNEEAVCKEDAGERVIGCCFYTEQDLNQFLHGDTELLRFSFGNYFDKPTTEEVGQIIAEELKKAGLSVVWDGTAGTKIGIRDFQWDKYYTDDE